MLKLLVLLLVIINNMFVQDKKADSNVLKALIKENTNFIEIYNKEIFNTDYLIKFFIINSINIAKLSKMEWTIIFDKFGITGYIKDKLKEKIEKYLTKYLVTIKVLIQKIKENNKKIINELKNKNEINLVNDKCNFIISLFRGEKSKEECLSDFENTFNIYLEKYSTLSLELNNVEIYDDFKNFLPTLYKLQRLISIKRFKRLYIIKDIFKKNFKEIVSLELNIYFLFNNLKIGLEKINNDPIKTYVNILKEERTIEKIIKYLEIIKTNKSQILLFYKSHEIKYMALILEKSRDIILDISYFNLMDSFSVFKFRRKSDYFVAKLNEYKDLLLYN